VDGRSGFRVASMLERMRATKDGQLLVMDDDRVVGCISRADLARLAVRARAVAGS
jgi:predicted transcriptional regulator